MASMPAFDPNAFSDGISNTEWTMLRENDHVPLLNKSLQGLYPPGSTVKPIAALAILRHGIDPKETIFCNGGYRLGNRTFKCLGRHGTMNLTSAIMKSCNTYFYAMGRRVGYDGIANVARELGLGAEYELPFQSQRYGTVPDSEWKMRKQGKPWADSDTLNATIGQGYLLVNPFQLAVMAARIASGRNLDPHIFPRKNRATATLSFPEEHLAIVREGMNLVVNGAGTAVRSRLPLEGVTMAGKTGTAQVRKIEGSQRGQSGEWKYRDHGLFVCFAPVEKPRYAAAVVIEHGLGGARAAAPVARDFLTYIYDPAKAMAALEALEAGWGGDINTRMAADRARWKLSRAPTAPALTTPTTEPVGNASRTANSAAAPAPAQPATTASIPPAIVAGADD